MAEPIDRAELRRHEALADKVLRGRSVMGGAAMIAAALRAARDMLENASAGGRYYKTTIAAIDAALEAK